jgi:hypothetical protein
MNQKRIPCLSSHRKLFVGAASVALAVLLPAAANAAMPAAVRAGTTTTYGVLAASTITNTGATTISGTAGGDIGLSPGTAVTGSASITRSGVSHITDTAASIAQTDLITAFNDLGVPAATQLSSADLAGRTLTPGTYNTAGGTLANSGTLTLNGGGDPSAVFIFRAASTLTTSTGSTMTLTNGAQACNVYWQVGSSATLGVNSTFIGHIYALTSITATTGARITGQLLARNGAVTLDTNTITNNACVAAVTTTTAASRTTTTVRGTATTVAGSTATTVPGSTETTVEGSGTQLPGTGINTLIWLVGVITIVGLALGIFRVRR